jgi:hypothetical protein
MATILRLLKRLTKQWHANHSHFGPGDFLV